MTAESAMATTPSRRDPDPVALVHLAGVGRGVAHGPGDLGRHHPRRRLAHGGRVDRRAGRRVVGQQGGEALDDAPGAPRPAPSCRSARRPARPPGGCSCCWAGSPPRPSRPTSTTLSRSAVEGFIDWPPTTWWCTPSERKMRPMPSPVTTATTLVVGAARRPRGSAPPPGALDASRTQRSSSTCSARSVTRIRCGRPGVDPGLDGGPDVVGVDVAVPQPVAADHHDGVADARPHLLEVVDGVVRRVQEVHDLVAQVAHVVRSPSPAPSVRVRRPRILRRRRGRRVGAATPEGSGSGRPSTTSRTHRARAGSPRPRRRPRRPAPGPAAARASGPGRPPPRRGPAPRTPTRPEPTAAGRRALGGRRGHGEDRPLHRPHHGPAGQDRGVRRTRRPAARAPRRARRPRPCVRSCPGAAGRGSRPSSPGPPSASRGRWRVQTSGSPAPAVTPSSSVTTASSVSAMLVPVSPSGTG